MILGIDASNIKSGGGLTHLIELLSNANPNVFGFEQVIIWSGEKVLVNLPDFPWLTKVSHRFLDRTFVYTFIFQIFFLSKQAKSLYNCNILFVPGGTFWGAFEDIVTMSQNMLPFEREESNRFSNWKTRLKFRILNFAQSRTFKRSKGLIFLSHYAKNYISNDIDLSKESVVIAHGINPIFLNTPKKQHHISSYSSENPFRLLYVSIITAYKHQWNVAEAVMKLNSEGYPVVLDLVGEANQESLLQLSRVILKDINGSINYKGFITYEKLSAIYRNADGFVFASSCENMPIILIEAMTAGLPIACSNKGPMPEVLGEAGFYFDPLNVSSIYDSIKELLDNKDLRCEYSNKSFKKSIKYTWKDCSDKTFKYLSEIAEVKNDENKK